MMAASTIASAAMRHTRTAIITIDEILVDYQGCTGAIDSYIWDL